MQRWIIMISCLLLWQEGGMAQGKKRMPAEMTRKVKELSVQAGALYEKGEYDAALEPARKCLEIHERYLGSKHPDVAKALNNLALLHDAKGDYAQAQPLFERALAIREKILGSVHPDVAEALNNLAELFRVKGDYGRAQPLFERALAIREKALGPGHPAVATSLNNLAVLHQAKGDYERAQPLFERALAIQENTLGPSHLDVARSLNNLALMYKAKGDYERALLLYERALAILENTLGPSHRDVAISLNNLALLHVAKGDYERALPLYERARAIQEKVLGPTHPDVAISLNNLALLHVAKGDYERALPLYERALAISEKTRGPNHPNVAASLNNLAMLYVAMGDYKRALPLYERTLAVAEKALGPNHPKVAYSLNNLAMLYVAKGDYERALPLYERAVAIVEKARGPNHPNVAATLSNLAVLYEAKGDYERALPLHKRAVAIVEKALGPDHRDVAASLNNLASLYEAKADYEHAQPLYERAVAIVEKVLGPEHPDVATSLNNLAGLHKAKGDYKRAQPLYERALAIREKTLGPDHPDVAQSLNNLAGLHRARGDHEQALYERALAIREKALGPTHPNVAQSLNNLAGLHWAKGDYKRAQPLYERTLAIREKALGPTHPAVATSLNNLALLHQAKGDYERAQALHKRALAIREKALGPNHPTVVNSLHNLASLYWLQGNIAEAIHYFRRVEAACEAHLELTIMADSEQAKRMFLATMTSDTDWNLSLALQSGHPDAMHLAATKVLRRKGRVLHSMTATFAAVRHHSDTRVRALWDEYRSNRTQYATQLMRGPGKITSEQHRKNLDTLQAHAMELERLLGDKSRAFRDEQTPVTVEAVEDALPRDAALVEWMRYRSRDLSVPQPHGVKPLRYAVCLLLAASPPRCLDLGDAKTIDADIKEMRNALARNLATVSRIARRLDARIMAPVRARLGDITHVYLSPDGPLHLIPFAALRDENDHYLVDRYTFTYVTTGRDLLHRTSTERASSQVVITADPARGEPLPGQREAFSFTPLPAAAQEAATVAAMFREPLMLQGADASEARVKQIHSPLIWHHAGHASYKPVTCAPGVKAPDDPRLQSVLPMAGANVCRDGDDDGLLTAVEVAGLDLGGTKLVVLSSCESGVGATSLGDTQGHVADGVYGLRRALVIAGSETQVMSLWRVDDHATRYLMEAYYHNLLAQGMGRSEALRQVQLAWLDSGSRYASPAYWAAFVVSGNDAPLDAGASSTVPRVQRSPRGCACDASSPNLGLGSGIALLLGLVLLMLQRRRA